MSAPVYNEFIRKILIEVHPDTSILVSTLKFFNQMIRNICSWLVNYMNNNNYKNVTDEIVIDFFEWFLGKELLEHAKSEILKAHSRVPRIPNKITKKIGREISNISNKQITKSVEGFDALAYGIEYLLAEFLELSGNVARDWRLSRIETNHVFIAAKNDTELSLLFPYILYNKKELLLIQSNVNKKLSNKSNSEQKSARSQKIYQDQSNEIQKKHSKKKGLIISV